MKPKIAIGLTTYLDISLPEFGVKLFNAYHMASAKIVPTKVNVWGRAYDVATASEFSRHWATNAQSRLVEDRGKGRLIEKSDFLIGCEWRHVGQPTGEGRVDFRPLDDLARSNTILIDHSFASRVDWSLLFQKLVEIFQPSYGMLHLFTAHEIDSLAVRSERFENFDRAFGGEEYFVSWRTNSGDWRKPDKWQLDERRQYRYLPELSWANFLGREFTGQYDKKFLSEHAANPRIMQNGLYFETTGNLSDVANDYQAYVQSRRILKSAFRPDFFRRQNPSY
ncbi:MAG: hypothetical protein IBJ12_10395 [Sphingomonadaceae bacterium]|nr:hypothetical protein [Sphingomonadaceae bacterium]